MDFSGLRRVLARFNISCTLVGNHPLSLTGHPAGLGVYSDWGGTSIWLNYAIGSDAWGFAKATFPGGSRRTASSFAIGKSGYVLLGKSGCHCANKIDVWKFDPSKPN